MFYNIDPKEFVSLNTKLATFIGKIVNHDYSYAMSDDDRYYRAGAKSEDEITSDLRELAKYFNLDLLQEYCYEKRTEQFTDGLTHRVIRGWFEVYKLLN